MSRVTNKESGVGHFVLIAAIVIVLVVAGAAIWSLTKNSPNTNKNNTSPSGSIAVNAPESNVCLNSFHDDTLCAFAPNVNVLGMSYIATGLATSLNGSKSTFTYENDGNNDLEVTYISGNNQITAISLSGTEYVQVGSGTTWLEYTGGSSNPYASVLTLFSSFNLKFTSTTSSEFSFAKTGTAACGSLTCVEYKVTVLSAPLVKQYIYFDTSKYYLRQWSYDNPSSGVSVDANFSYQALTISKPSPVQSES